MSASWGCSCGRLCDASDRFCVGCGSPQTSGTVVENEADKAKFLKKAELDDATALRGVRRTLRDGEKSYQQAGDEMDQHILADYKKFDGWFGEWLRGTPGRVDHYGMPIDDYWDEYDDFD